MASNEGGYLVEQGTDKHLPTHRNGAVDWRLAGAAWAALHGGYRGNKYEGPDKEGALARLSAIYRRAGRPTPTK